MIRGGGGGGMEGTSWKDKARDRLEVEDIEMRE